MLPPWTGSILFFDLFIWMIFFMLDAFHSSYYFKDSENALREFKFLGQEISYEAAKIALSTDDFDITKGFLGSRLGRLILLRCGLGLSDINQFAVSQRKLISAESFSLDGEKIGLYEYARAVIKQDKDFSDFLFSLGLQESDFLGAADWVSKIAAATKAKERWWSRDNLGKLPGLGKDWAYGRAYELEKFASFIGEKYEYSLIDNNSAYHRSEVDSLEKILSRAKEANALIVSEEGDGALDIVIRLARKIADGSVLPALEHKRIAILDTNAIIDVTKEKTAFENEIIKILNQSIKAGNIILVIQDLPALIQNARNLGSNFIDLVDPYLASSYLQFVAFADTGRFHQSVESDGGIMRRFEKIIIKEDNDGGVILRLLEEKALEYEARQNIYFTYPSIVAIWKSADRYFNDGTLPEKAVDLLVESIPSVKQRGKNIVEKSDIEALVGAKTGIPVGEVKDSEKKKLLNLEEILHKRVVGQDAAISAISNAMRRARSGVANPNRPIGSFLFLGPTGVGKTETSKALAEVFFGNENCMMRLDMSEYTSADALDKLIGSFDEGKPGVLSSMIREKPYAVLLLDEFEKTTDRVKDLFLQIVDEGMFADMSGKKVNARNLIIIATSNAGSDIIWNLAKEEKKLVESKDAIIEDIINQGIFKPEMINRFDGVIIFNPLKENDLQSIAGNMLEKLKARIREKGFDLVINNDLINYLVSQGTDPKFGARPLNRAIQDKVEEIIAEKIIRGDLRPGSSISLTQEELVK
jgi:ATP-dependent Clp protease ATP-binding subunit ClpC